MQRAAFAGSFDPPTFGHLDIIERAAKLFDELVIVVADNKQKKQVLTPEKRVLLLSNLTQKIPAVTVLLCPQATLFVDFLKTLNIRTAVRGLRSITDFEYEAEMARINKLYFPEFETVFLPAQTELLAIRSSSVRELLAHHADISCFVPKEIIQALAANKNE